MCEDCGAHGGDGHEHGHEHGHKHGHEHGHNHSHEHGHNHSHDHGHDHSHEGDHGHTHEHDHDHTHVHSNDTDHTHDHETDAPIDDSPGPIRIAVTGKGGVGKTTLSAAIAAHLAAHQAVTVIDADPDMNLAGTLGVEAPPPITEERDLIEERAGGGGLVNLTPEVEDVLDTHSTSFGTGGQLLTIGAPSGANSGCMCPENSFVRTLVSTALGEESVVLDMEAGVEHLGRGTADSVDAMLVVVEPSQASIDTATRIDGLAEELGIQDVRAVVNKTRDNGERVAEALPVPVVATLPYDEAIGAAALAGQPPVNESQALRDTAARIVDRLVEASDDPIATV